MSKWLLAAVLAGSLIQLPPAPSQTQPDTYEGPIPISTVEPVISPLVYAGGMVATRVKVAADGSVMDVEVLTAFPALTDPVVNAVRQWRFTPATRDGKAVEGVAIVAVQIHMNRAVVG